MNDEPENPWKKLTEAARTSSPGAAPAAPPPRVAEFRQRVMAVVRAILWRRVSLALAAGAGLAWLVIWLQSPDETPPPLIPLPPDVLQTP